METLQQTDISKLHVYTCRGQTAPFKHFKHSYVESGIRARYHEVTMEPLGLQIPDVDRVIQASTDQVQRGGVQAHTSLLFLEWRSKRFVYDTFIH